MWYVKNRIKQFKYDIKKQNEQIFSSIKTLKLIFSFYI